MAGSILPTLQKIPEQEGSFRKKTLEGLVKVIKDDSVPPSLRALTLMFFFVVILVSFTVGIFVINLLGAAAHLTGLVQPEYYISLVMGEVLVGLIGAYPLIRRFDSYGQARHLEETLEKAAVHKSQMKSGRRGTRKERPTHVDGP